MPMQGTEPVPHAEPERDSRKVERDRRTVERGFWRKLRKTVGRIPFTRELLAAYYCASDPATPSHVKAVLMAALAYFVIPTDMIPDFIAAFGFSDDASVLALTVATVSSHIKPAHQERAAAYLENPIDLED